MATTLLKLDRSDGLAAVEVSGPDEDEFPFINCEEELAEAPLVEVPLPLLLLTSVDDAGAENLNNLLS